MPRHVAYGVLLLLFCIAALVAYVPLQNAYERATLALSPSAARAAAYGERHFDARHPALYDIARAEYFYREAYRLDPSYPYVNHQLGRIEFLKGNFNAALYRLDEELELFGGKHPDSYYVRGLIEGYMGRYEDSIRDYERFLLAQPDNWAGMNDYAWVLLKAKRYKDAAAITQHALLRFPANAWLLNSHAIALYELGDYANALSSAKSAVAAAAKLTEEEWLDAYPGNDPQVASQGIAAFRTSAEDNMHRIEDALASSTIQSD